jgi:microcystin-dependent protein
MPSHNHNQATASPGANTIVDGTTSVQADHIHSITDPGHSHAVSYYTPSSATTAVLPGHEVADNTTIITSTSPSLTGITATNAAGAHSHTISSNGGDQYHNNIQPTLFYGNTFIYCGVPMRGEFPFKTGLAPVLI